MKRIYLLLFAAIPAASYKPRSNQNQNNNDEPIITVTLRPLRYFTGAIASDHSTVVNTIPRGTGLKTYDPAPQQLADPAHSRVYFHISYIGFGQNWIDKLIGNAPHLQFFGMSQGIDLVYGDTRIHHHTMDEGEHLRATGAEPHIWNSTISAQIIAGNILSTLYSVDKNNENSYMKRYNALCRQIERTDNLIWQTLAIPGADRAFMIYHPALSYFARDYRLHQIPIETGGKESSPAHLRALIDACKGKKVYAISTQPEFDRRNVKLTVRQAGTCVVDISPLSYDWETEVMHTTGSLAEK